MAKEHSAFDWITFILVVIGALNWGLVGAFSFNVVDTIFGRGMIARIVYILVGLSGIWMIVKMAKK